jgi:hypothetical protein
MLALIVLVEGAAIASRADIFWPFSPHEMFASLEPKRPFPVVVLRGVGTSGELNLVAADVLSFEIQRLLVRGFQRSDDPAQRERTLDALVDYVAHALARARARGELLTPLASLRIERWRFPLDDLSGPRLPREREVLAERTLP